VRLTEEQVREAFKHPDLRARQAALEYFAASYSRNAAIMPEVIASIEQFGPTEAFESTYQIPNLAQTPETVTWAIGKLRGFERPSSSRDQRHFARSLRRLLLEADPQAVAPHREAILALPGLPPLAVTRLQRRFELESKPADQLWRRLEEIAEAGKNEVRRKKIEGSEAKAIISVLACDAANADRMSEILGQEYDTDTPTPMIWLEVFAVRMAGEMRHEPAVPLLIEKLKCGGLTLLEEANEALLKIGTDEVVHAVRDEFLSADEDFRTYTMSIFGRIHSDAAISAGLELLREMDENENDDSDPEEFEEDRAWLACEFVGQLSTEAIDACREVLLTAPVYVAYDLQVGLVTACKLTGYQVPEMNQWEKELASPERYFNSDYNDSDDDLVDEVFDDDDESLSLDDEPADGFDDSGPLRLDPLGELAEPADEPEILTRAAPVGRNDPCPCGSGKKYKKCCMREQPLS